VNRADQDNGSDIWPSRGQKSASGWVQTEKTDNSTNHADRLVRAGEGGQFEIKLKDRIERGDLGGIRRDFENDKLGNVNRGLDADGNSAAHLSCMHGFNEILQQLIDYGADPSNLNKVRRRASSSLLSSGCSSFSLCST
jgi:ankyrin repeat protein